MTDVIAISSLDIPELHSYKTLRQSAEHFREGIFVAEGEKVVRRLIESRLEILSVLITPDWLDEYRPLLEARPEPIRVFTASKNIVETIVGFNLHQGIMALGKIPVPAALESVLADAPRPYFLAALDGLTNSENLGVVVRNCAAFGVHGILVGETSSSPYLRRAVRNSMGSVFTLPIVHCRNLMETLQTLRTQYGISVLAAHPHAEKHTLSTTDCTKDLCIVLGSEGNGISSCILAVCDRAVAVPMHGSVDSLNVASACAVFLYEVIRQRQPAKT
ncbi:MAG: RNA methyltransferase [Bacteroidota bacterium]